MVGPCLPFGSQSSIIFTLIPSTPFKQVNKKLLPAKANGYIFIPIPSNKKQTCLRRTCLTAESIYRLTGWPEEIMYPSLNFMDLARWALSFPLTITCRTQKGRSIYKSYQELNLIETARTSLGRMGGHIPHSLWHHSP